MYKRHLIGKIGEDIASKYLIEKGYIIIERNFRCKQGELDIIAKFEESIVFVEVKTRTNKKYGEPIDAVTYMKKMHILKSINYYLYSKGIENQSIRIDIIEVYIRENKYYIKHTKNAIIA